MKRYLNGFPSSLSGVDFDTIEKDGQSIFGLSRDLTFNYFNPAWYAFAAKNDGEPDISLNYSLGTSLKSAIAGEIAEFYQNQYEKVLLTGNVWEHDYECSSHSTYRLFRQISYPLKNNEGIIVVNSLRKEQSMDQCGREVFSPDKRAYTQETGFITQCCNCRRVQRVGQPDIWDWVPAWVVRMPNNLSHSICPICMDYYWKYSNQN